MNLAAFRGVLVHVYQEGRFDYSFEDAWHVFTFYFRKYREWCGEDHPILSRKIVKEIVEKMPRTKENEFELDPECYEDLIEQHFKTEYNDCDYNICHFFSGRIRDLRFFDCGYY